MTAEAAALRGLQNDDITRVRWLSGVECAPDGSAVAAVESRLDIQTGALTSALLVVDRTGALVTSTPPLTNARDARWDPAGRRLAFVANSGERPQLWLWTIGDADPVPILDSAFDVAGPPSWSPEGAHLVYPVSAGGANRWLRIHETATGQHVDLTDAAGSDHHCRWSPDGSRVAFLSDRTAGGPPGPDALWCVDVGGGSLRRLTEVGGLVQAPVWSPDSQSLAYIGNDDAYNDAVNGQLRVVDVATGAVRSLTQRLDVSIGGCVKSDDPRGYGDAKLCWPKGDRGILCTFPVGGSVRLAWIAPENPPAQVDELKTVRAGRCVVLSFSSSADGASVAYVLTDSRSPGDLHLARDDGSGDVCLAARNDWLSRVALSDVEHRTVPTSDGDAVEAWLYPPAESAGRSAPWPLVVAVHGGPHWPCGWRFSFEYQRLAACGFAVAVGNPRGSQGYGERYSTVIQTDWANHDYADVLALTRDLAADDRVDSSRLAITGVSYGGYLTCWAVANDGPFVAAVAENPITDLRTYRDFAMTQPGGAAQCASEFGDRDSIEELLRARSPLTFAERIATPLLLVHAELDDNCPISESRQLYEVLGRAGRDVQFEVIPGEGHSMVLDGTLPHRLRRWGVIDEFLNGHLCPTPR